MDMSYIGNRIRQRRKKLGLSIMQVNEYTGISSGNLSEIETGKKLPSTPALISLSKVLNCSIDSLLIEDYNSHIISNENALSDFELSLLRDLRSLSPEDQNEIYEIIKLKLRKKAKIKDEILSSFQDNNSSLLA